VLGINSFHFYVTLIAVGVSLDMRIVVVAAKVNDTASDLISIDHLD
jgi:hypothetical protein